MAQRDNFHRVAALLVLTTLGFLGYQLWQYRAFRELAERGLTVRATIDNVRSVDEEDPHDVVHYRYTVGGREFSFDTDSTDALDAFTTPYSGCVGRPDCPLRVGGTVPLVVDPERPEVHRVDRRQVEADWLNWLFLLLPGLFLGLLTAVTVWAGVKRSARA